MNNHLKIGSYNIRHGSDNGQNVAKIGKLLKSYDLDIIGIQEIDLFVRRSGNIDVLKEIAQVGDYQYYQFYKTINYQNGDYGLGIISKYPINNISQTILTHSQEQRILVHSKIDIDGEQINFLVTHLELGNYQDIRIHQFNQINNILKELKSFILTGDFNVQDWRKAGNIFEFGEHFQDYNIVNNPSNTFLTYSGKECIGGGVSPIDNIITSPNYKINKSQMIDTNYSDHDLLICDLDIGN